MSKHSHKSGAAYSAALTTVQIEGAGGPTFKGNVRKVGEQVPDEQADGPSWSFDLAAGDYIFNVDIVGIAGTTAKFSFTGATASPPTSFNLPNTPGAGSSLNRDVSFTVAPAAAQGAGQ